jgi:hypothetical protein
MTLRKNMVANAIKVLALLLARAVLIIYGLIDLLGVVWYSGSIYLADLLTGLLFAGSAIFVGSYPLVVKHLPYISLRLYIAIIAVGILPTLFLSVKYITSNNSNWDNIIEQLLLIFCFTIMLLAKMNQTAIDSD